MKPLAVCLALALVLLGGVGHASSVPRAEIFVETGTKALKKSCTITARGGGHTGGVALFDVSESGAGCGNYLLRAASVITELGHHVVVQSWQDLIDDPRIEDLEVSGDTGEDGFRYGDFVVYAPYRSRCDRYRLAGNGTAHGTIQYLDSWPCSGSRYPSDNKVFKQDCAVIMDTELGVGPTRDFVARETGNDCDAYVLRGISEVLTTGQRAFSNRDATFDPDLEAMSVSISPVGGTLDIAYGTIDVYIPALSRCDRYRYYPRVAVRYLDSRPCSSA
jgi:hypothetical protein